MENDKTIYKINNITEYGKFISFCIEHKIDVCKCVWNPKMRYFYIDWRNEICYAGTANYFEKYGISLKFDCIIIRPTFIMDKYGHYQIVTECTCKTCCLHGSLLCPHMPDNADIYCEDWLQ